ncbi:MAG: tRNA (adenosine(37)-N6)-threonylcarbamoyltransferase complex ATPase subunit type 1 TsaE [Myxococcota bacterium]|nr:tRNA (adenosine(37)-N6)-threonylcarbamoyltransferase complex ATPase subunit type 1 TsaE [Myxococcota bacterium]
MRLSSPGPDATRAAAELLGACLAGRVREPLVVALVGPLGAGKTAFVQGLAAGLGIDPTLVASPTFVIASEYDGPEERLAHVDLYRVESVGELEAAGFLDLLEPGVVIAVEWADRFPAALPADRLEVCLERPDAAADPGLRVLHAKGSGAHGEAVLARWREALAARPDLAPR